MIDVCRNQKNAQYSLFRKEIYPSGLHIEREDGNPTHCPECLQKALKKDENSIYVGFLCATDSEKYAATIKGGEFQQFRENSITVLKANLLHTAVKAAFAYPLTEFATAKGNLTVSLTAKQK